MYTPSKTLLNTFITFAIASIVSLAMRELDSFIFASSIADVLGIYMAVKSFRS